MQLISILQAILWALSSIAIPAGFPAFCQAAAPVVVTALWQGTAVAVALEICLRLAPLLSAAHRFAIRLSGFVALVTLPLLPLFAGHTAAAPLGISSQVAEAHAGPWLQLDIRWSMAIAALWAAASLARAIDLAIHSLRLRKLWRTALPMANRTIVSIPCLDQLPGRRPVQVCTTRQLDRPGVIGFFAPRILIPEWLITRLTSGELKQIVLHEVEHLRRGDDWTNLFQKLCLVLFPLNPALWWMERRLCAEREMACDDGVIRITHAPRAYAACLASLAECGLRPPAEALSLGAWQRRPELVHRVHSILASSRALSPLATRTLLGALTCGLVFASVELARCPQLIAFVAPQRAEAALVLATANPRTDSSPSLNEASAPVRQSGFVRGASGFRAMNAKAVVPAAPQAPVRRSANAAGERVASSAQLASNFPRVETLKAVMPGRKPTTPHAQQWVVLTTWERVQTPGRNLQPSSDHVSDQSTDMGKSNDETQQNGQPTTQITVTRMIFRVVPLSSRSTQPAPLPVHADWLVFQL